MTADIWDQDSVKNCRRSEILALLHANKLVNHSFMDIGKRHETPASEKKDSLFLTEVARVWTFLVLVPPTQILTGHHEEGQITAAHTVGCNIGEDPLA